MSPVQVRAGPFSHNQKRGVVFLLAQYTLRPYVPRLLVPRLLRDLFLLLVMGFAIILNLKLLGVNLNIITYLITTVVLIIILIIDFILTKTNISLISYYFYPDKIEAVGKKSFTIPFNDVNSITLKQNIFDKLFNTASIFFIYNSSSRSKQSLSAILNYQQVFGYVQKLWSMQYSSTLAHGSATAIYNSQQQPVLNANLSSNTSNSTNTVPPETVNTQNPQSNSSTNTSAPAYRYPQKSQQNQVQQLNLSQQNYQHNQ